MSEKQVFSRGQLPIGGVIVTDGNERSALAAVRSLGARGVPVYIGAETSSSLAGASRYCQGRFVYPSPWTHPQEYLASLLTHARQFHAGLIFPMTDVAVEILGEYQRRGGNELTLPIPSSADYHSLSDKYRLIEWAESAGVPVPVTVYLPNRHGIESVIEKVTHWPVIVKPGRSVTKDGTLWKKTSVAVASDQDSLRQLYRDRWYLKWPSLIQEQVVGYGEGVFGLFVEGKPVVLFAHRRLREKPPSGGVSVLRESIPLPQAMSSYALRIMQSVTWQGVAMVEFKVSASTGVPYLMEVNGRFWGSLQLAIDAGIDFPWLLYQLATTGQCLVDSTPYRVGVKSRWWLGDLDHMLIRVRQSDEKLNLPPGSLSCWETCKNVFDMWDPTTKSEVFRANDSRPAIFELGTYVRDLVCSPINKLRNKIMLANRVSKKLVRSLGCVSGVSRRRLQTALQGPVRRILVLCKGNICRSPFAAEYLRVKVQEQNLKLEVSSAGLDTNAGDPADPMAQRVAAQYGIDLMHHRTAVLPGDMVAKADLIVVMEQTHEDVLFQSFPEARAKTWMMGHFASPPVTEIHDPFGKSPEMFSQCYSVIAQACDNLLVAIQDGK